MRRRTFIISSSAALLAPRLVRAQGWAPLVGYLHPQSREGSSQLDAFLGGMNALGYVEGRDFTVVARFADGYTDRLPELAQELIGLGPAVLVAPTGGSARAFAQATRTIPIVANFPGDFAPDLVGGDFARPAGNVTGTLGIEASQVGKQIQIMTETVPGATRLGLLIGASRAPVEAEAAAAAAATRISLVVVRVRTPDALEGAFQTLARERVNAVVASNEGLFTSERQQMAALAAKAQLPVIYHSDEIAEAGGLMSYGIDQRGRPRRLAVYVDMILKGAKPGDLPVEQPSTFILAVNLGAARELGLTFPPAILARADVVIE